MVSGQILTTTMGMSTTTIMTRNLVRRRRRPRWLQSSPTSSSSSSSKSSTLSSSSYRPLTRQSSMISVPCQDGHDRISRRYCYCWCFDRHYLDLNLPQPISSDVQSKATTTSTSRRHYSTTGVASDDDGQDNSSSSTVVGRRENALDKFTHYALNSNALPLGTMDENQWLDVLSAIEGWINLDGDDDVVVDGVDNDGNNDAHIGCTRGYAADSAHRLLQRIKWELAVTQSSAFVRLAERQQQDIGLSPPTSVYGQRAKWIDDLTIRVIQSWFDAFHTAYPSPSSSLLALTKIEELLHELQQQHQQKQQHDTTTAATILNFWVGLIDGYLRLESSIGIEKASNLMLPLTDIVSTTMTIMATTTTISLDSEKTKPSDKIRGRIPVEELFDRSIRQCISIKRSYDDAHKLLNLMDAMVESGYLSERPLSKETENLIAQFVLNESDSSTIKQGDIESESPDDISVTDTDDVSETKVTAEKTKLVLSSFEMKSVEQRLLNAIRNYQKQDHGSVISEIDSMIEMLSTLEVSSDIILAIIKFYVTNDDVENASKWLNKLEPMFLVTTSIVEDVLIMWLRLRGPRIPWQAESVFKRVLDRIDHAESGSEVKDLSFIPKCFGILMKIWLASNDLKANRKVFDLFVEMYRDRKVKPDSSTIRLVLDATSSGAVQGAVDVVTDTVIHEWATFSTDEKIALAGSVLHALAEDQSVDNIQMILELLASDGIQLTDTIFKLCLDALKNSRSTESSNVLALVDSFAKATSMRNPTSLYTAAIQTLLKIGTTKSSDAIDSLFSKGLGLIESNAGSITKDDASDFLLHVIAMHVNRKLYADAEKYLLRAEKSLLDEDQVFSHASARHSLIPLECYRRLIVRKWYTSKNSPPIVSTFRRLKKFAMLGYSNLQPDLQIYAGFIRALAVMGKAEDLEGAFEEMIAHYKATMNESTKPSVELYNTILLAYVHNENIAKFEPQSATRILQSMEDLDVSPDVRTLNLVLQSILNRRNQSTFSEVTQLISRLQQKFKVEPDSYTRHLLLDACTTATRQQRDEALKKSLATLHEIRLNKNVGPTTYGIMSRAINILNRRGEEGDRIAGLCFSLCCEDGYLTSQVRARFQKSMSSRAWSKEYFEKLSPSHAEPDAWSRSIVKGD